MIRRPPKSSLIPYTTLYRSEPDARPDRHLLLRRVAVRLGHPHRPRQGSTLEPRHALVDLQEHEGRRPQDRKSTRLNSSHANISYAVFCLKKKNHNQTVFLSD